MKYKAYSYGQIVGPFEPSDLRQQSWFDENTLVCPETKSGLNASDWKKAKEWGDLIGPADLMGGAQDTSQTQAKMASPPASAAINLSREKEELVKTFELIKNKLDDLEAKLLEKTNEIKELRNQVSGLDKTAQITELFTGVKGQDAKLQEFNKKLTELAQETSKSKNSDTEKTLADLAHRALEDRGHNQKEMERLSKELLNLSKVLEEMRRVSPPPAQKPAIPVQAPEPAPKPVAPPAVQEAPAKPPAPAPVQEIPAPPPKIPPIPLKPEAAKPAAKASLQDQKKTKSLKIPILAAAALFLIIAGFLAYRSFQGSNETEELVEIMPLKTIPQEPQSLEEPLAQEPPPPPIRAEAATPAPEPPAPVKAEKKSKKAASKTVAAKKPAKKESPPLPGFGPLPGMENTSSSEKGQSRLTVKPASSKSTPSPSTTRNSENFFED